MSEPKKKLTKKELKALNHAKLMNNRKGGFSTPTQSSGASGTSNNVLPFKPEQQKKVA